MGLVQLRQIKEHIQAQYVPDIDMTDYANKSEDEKSNAVLSRSIAAFAVANAADIDPKIAAASIVDGFNDNGIDAIYFSEVNKTLYICQAKWSVNGTGTIDQGSIEKFIKGVKDLLNIRLERFNEKVQVRKAALETSIVSALKIVLLVAYSGSDQMGAHPKRSLVDFIDELNDTGEVASMEIFTQSEIYTIVSSGGRSAPVDLVVQLFDWGQTKVPYQAFYGQVAASDVADWGVKYRQRLYAKNIRSFLGGKTAVNESIADSVKREPNNFWYLNNGVTALCSAIRKRPIGGSSHDAGTFECDGIAIVNGAQTVGSLSELLNSHPQQLQAARVPIRLISLEGCPPEFAQEVTRATNTQNRVDSRNFVALDKEQERLRAELLVDNIEYEYWQGEGEPVGGTKFGLVEATVALACSSSSPELAVQAKREISKLWEDLGRPPYKTMFNSSLTGLKLWRLVRLLREMDIALEKERSQSNDPRRRNIAVHGNRLVSHIVFKSLDLSNIENDSFDLSTLVMSIEGAVGAAISEVQRCIDTTYADSYLASLFKNATKCRDIAANVAL